MDAHCFCEAVKQKNRKITIALLLLLFCAFAAFGASLFSGFLIDDDHLIINNPDIKGINCFYKVFQNPFLKDYYRPLTALSYAADFSIWKLNPFGYHLTNILLHFLNGILFFFFIWMLFSDYNLALFASVLFIVHPINSVTVNYVADRGNLLVGIFMSGGLLGFLAGYKKRKKLLYAAALFSFFLALLCRENAVLFTLYLACVFFYCYEKERRRETLILVLVSACLVFLYLIFRIKFIPNAVLMPSMDMQEYFTLKSLTAFFTMLGTYILLAVFPLKIFFFQQIETNDIGYVIAAVAIAVIFFAVLIRVKKYRRELVFSFCWFLAGAVALFRMMFYRPIIGFAMQVSWIYFSSVGLFLIAGIILLRMNILSRFGFKFKAAFLSGILIFYTAISIFQTLLWKTPETYCLNWLKAVPKNPIASWELAEYYYEKKQFDKSIGYYKRAAADSKVERNGRVIWDALLPEILNNWGATLYEQGELDEAHKCFQSALTVGGQADKSNAHFNMANIYYLKQDWEQAIHHYQEALRYDFYYLRVYRILTLLYLKKDDPYNARYFDTVYKYVSALKQCEDIADIRKDTVQKLNTLGKIFFKKDRLSESEMCFSSILKLKNIDNSDSFTAYCGLFMVNKKIGNQAKAAKNLKQALKLKPELLETINKQQNK